MNKRQFFEVSAVIATGCLHLLLVELFHAGGALVALALIGWGAYAVCRARADDRALYRWGFSSHALRESFLASSIVASVAMVAMALIAHYNGSLGAQWDLLLLLFLYPVWGLVQQFLVQAVVVGNLSQGGMSSSLVLALAAATLFAMVHLPNFRLAGAAFGLGFCFTLIYLKWRNLWPLGLYHGWLGVFFYLWVLRRDPLTGLLGR